MTRILVLGDSSYVGRSLRRWTATRGAGSAFGISARGEGWRSHDLSQYDAIVNTVGIAHIPESSVRSEDYDAVNHRLAVDVAKQAKASGVALFVQISTMSVYGMSEGTISKRTIPQPKGAYGLSKLRADEAIQALEDDSFGVAVIRPPMIYGAGCKGNYAKLSQLARWVPAFPRHRNQRSMLYVDTMSAMLWEVVRERRTGLFHPQNHEYVCTSEMVQEIARVRGREVPLVRALDPLVRFTPAAMRQKVFGDLVYAKEEDLGAEQLSFNDTIRRTEGQ